MEPDRAIGVVAVLGAGTMGQGIAQVCAQAGCAVRLHDLDGVVLERALAGIRKGLDRLVEKGRLEVSERDRALGRVTATTDLAAAARGADLLVEAVPERLELKQALFRACSALVDAGAILATNTSSLSVGAIAGAATHPERVLGMHFFNPVPVMELLEIVRASETSDAVVAAVRAFGARIGKRSIVVRDRPGFATSRLGVVLGAEAIRMLEDGVASAEDIDLAMELGYRHPMGPLRLTDLVGLDVRLAILEHLERAIGPQFRPPELLRRLVAEGKLGRKTGEGFYKYER